jgi:hypothetical protein
LKPYHFVLDITLKGIGLQSEISGSKIHPVHTMTFTAYFRERIVWAAMEEYESQDAYNARNDGNPIPNIEYLHRALYYKGRIWIPATDDLHKITCEVEHNSKVASYMG